MKLGRPRPATGAGWLLAATSVGGSHLLLAPEAGARHGYGLLWLVVAAHLLKYPAFEFGSRYALATGRSLLDAYQQAPGPRNWALWVGLVDMVLESVGVLAAVIGLTASLAKASAGTGSLVSWGVAISVVGVLLVWRGRLGWLAGLCGAMLLMLAVGTAAAFFSALPDRAELQETITPAWPVGAGWLIAAILGWMPTGIGVSIWQSLWIVGAEQQGGGVDRRDAAYLARGLRGFRWGYGLSLVLALAFVSLGATVLRPAGLMPHGEEVAVTLSKLYTETVGPWLGPVFLVTALLGLLSTVVTCLDAFPRTLLQTLTKLFPERGIVADRRGALYWLYLSFAVIGGAALLAAVPDPERLILILGSVTFLFAPVYYALNLYAVRCLITDPALRSSAIGVAWAGLGLLALLGIATGLLYTTFTT